MKVGIVGVGRLGGDLAFTLARELAPEKLVLCDALPNLAHAQAEDVSQGIGATSTTDVRASSIDGMAGADVVVIAAGQGRKPGMTRLDLLRGNAPLVASLAREIARVAPAATLVVLTNPVDVLTTVAWRASRLARHRIVGSGALLDSVRLRGILADRLRAAPSEVDATVLGEHGDRIVAVFSRATVRGASVSLTPEEKRDILNATRVASERIMTVKGGTVFGPTGCTATLIKALASKTPSLVPASVVLDGEYGVRGVAMGVPAILGQGRVLRVEEWSLPPDERAALQLAARDLKSFVEDALGVLDLGARPTAQSPADSPRDS